MIGRRILAFWIDIFFGLFLSSTALWLLRKAFLLGTNPDDLFNPLREWALVPAHPIFLLWGLFLYFFLFLAVNSETPGLVAFGLTVVRDSDGGESSFIGGRRALVRSLLLGVSGLFLGLGFLTVLTNDRRLALHDCLSGTRIVRIRSRRVRPAGLP
ncbi:MAG: RDD family protein [Leptospirillia bacterium]